MLCIYTYVWYHSVSHSVLSAVHCSPLQSAVPQTLLQRFGVAAVRGVARNSSIAEFQLEPFVIEQQVVDGILAQLTPDERRKFRVGKGQYGRPSIERCALGEWCTVSLHMQCLCCVSQGLSQLYQRSSPSLPSWLCWLGGPALSCVWWWYRAF